MEHESLVYLPSFLRDIEWFGDLCGRIVIGYRLMFSLSIHASFVGLFTTKNGSRRPKNIKGGLRPGYLFSFLFLAQKGYL